MDMKKRETIMNIYVPSNILREIFLYLPCKSLCRFRFVSKHWRSCINDDQFMEEHRKHNMKASHVLLSWDNLFSTNLQLFSMSMDSYSHIKTIQTCKYNRALPSSYGMVCLHGWHDEEIALFNPSTQQIIPLPNLLKPSSFNLGFGFDPSSRRYKIIQLIAYGGTIRRFYIMTVTRNGSYWRTIHVKTSELLIGWHGYQQPLCVDGVLFWDTWSADAGTNILIFDLSAEEMRIIKSPAPTRGYPTYRGKLALLEGKLCCFDMNPTSHTSLTMNVWKFDNHVGWTHCYQFEISEPVLLSLELTPLYFFDNKTILFQEKTSFTKCVQTLYIYDSEDETLKIYPMTNKEGVVSSFDSMVHSETLNYSLD